MTLGVISPALTANAVNLQSSPAAVEVNAQGAKPRTIITTDGEIDDLDSFTRFLYYANEVDLEGIVLTSSKFHWAGDGADVPPYRWEGEDWIPEYIDDYATIYPALRVHADGYPSPDELRDLYKIGNIDNVGDTAAPTEGSEWIKQQMLADKPGPLFVQVWGGPNSAARALMSIEEEFGGSPNWGEIKRTISSKVVLYNILDQDPTLAEYIRPNWPDLKVIDNIDQYRAFGYEWRLSVPSDAEYSMKAPWITENIYEDHGTLTQRYFGWGRNSNGHVFADDRLNVVTDSSRSAEWAQFEPRFGTIEQDDFLSEGDSPSYMALFDFNGLRNSEDPTWGGWGGRFESTPTGWADGSDLNPVSGELDHRYPQARWIEAIQNDFAARVQWGETTNYTAANHAPQLSATPGLDLSATPGETVQLDAVASDPDGDDVLVDWSQYQEAGTYPGAVTMSTMEGATSSFTIPADAQPGQTIHIIATATDSADIPLRHYQRIVITVAETRTSEDSASPTSANEDAVSTLAATGSSAAILTGLATILTLTGIGAIIVRRRTRRS